MGSSRRSTDLRTKAGLIEHASKARLIRLAARRLGVRRLEHRPAPDEIEASKERWEQLRHEI